MGSSFMVVYSLGVGNKMFRLQETISRIVFSEQRLHQVAQFPSERHQFQKVDVRPGANDPSICEAIAQQKSHGPTRLQKIAVSNQRRGNGISVPQPQDTRVAFYLTDPPLYLGNGIF